MYALDLSGLSELSLLFTSLFHAFWPVLVILFVGSIVLLILGVGLKFGLGSIFSVTEHARIPSKKGIIKLALALAFLGMLFLSASSPTYVALGADGAAGSIEIGVTNILEKTPVTIHMYDLTGGADYQVNWTGDNTGHSFTTGASQDEHFITVTIDKPAASHDVTIYLRGQAAGAVVDSLSIYVGDTSIFPDDILIDIGITVAVVFVIVGAVMALKSRSS